jgi:hypothetical protein
LAAREQTCHEAEDVTAGGRGGAGRAGGGQLRERLSCGAAAVEQLCRRGGAALAHACASSSSAGGVGEGMGGGEQAQAQADRHRRLQALVAAGARWGGRHVEKVGFAVCWLATRLEASQQQGAAVGIFGPPIARLETLVAAAAAAGGADDAEESAAVLRHLGACLQGAAGVASFAAAVLTEIYLCNVCSCQEMLRRNGRGQGCRWTTRRRLAVAWGWHGWCSSTALPCCSWWLVPGRRRRWRRRWLRCSAGRSGWCATRTTPRCCRRAGVSWL